MCPNNVFKQLKLLTFSTSVMKDLKFNFKAKIYNQVDTLKIKTNNQTYFR